MNCELAFMPLNMTFETAGEYGDYFRSEADLLEAAGCRTKLVFAREHETQKALVGLQGVQGVMCAGNPPFSREVLAQLPELRFILKYGIGINTIDLAAASELGIAVYNTPAQCSHELAVHAAAFLLAGMRGLGFADRALRAGGAAAYTPRGIRGKTVGIFGFGDSGSVLAGMMRGLGAEVLTFDPYVRPELVKAFGAVRVDTLDELVSRSDMLSIHAPLTPETKHVFGRNMLAQMRRGAVLADIARGDIIDFEALYEALASGALAFAGLDTFDKEPLPPGHPIIGFAQTLLTPHTASYGEEARQLQQYLGAQLPLDFFVNKQIYRKNLRNPEVLEHFPDYRLLEAVPEPPCGLRTAVDAALPEIPPECTDLAEHGIALLLAGLRSLLWCDREMRAGRWIKAPIVPRRPQSLTVGIIGNHPAASYAAAALFRGFGAEILLCDPLESADPRFRRAPLEELLQQSDAVIVYTADIPLPVAGMKKNALLICPMGGESVETGALFSALQKGYLSHAAIAGEHPDARLRGLPNVTLAMPGGRI